MRVQKSFTIKEKRHGVGGELVTVNVGGLSSFAIMLANEPAEKRKYLVLSSKREIKHPFWVKDDSDDGFMISHGTDWVLDIGDANNIEIGEHGSENEFGSILYSENQAYMRVGGVKQDNDSLNKHVDMTTFIFATPVPAGETICVRSWKLWKSEGHMNTPSMSPMLSFTVE